MSPRGEGETREYYHFIAKIGLSSHQAKYCVSIKCNNFCFWMALASFRLVRGIRTGFLNYMGGFMKQALLVAFAIVTMVSNSAFASSLAPHQPVAVLQNVSAEIKTVTVDNYGLLTVELRDSGDLVEHQLSLANRQSIHDDAQMLANEIVITRHHQVVCMMMLRPFLPMLQISRVSEANNLFTGELRNVLSDRNCAMTTTIFPKEDYAVRAAEQMRQTLTVLANEFAAERN